MPVILTSTGIMGAHTTPKRIEEQQLYNSYLRKHLESFSVSANQQMTQVVFRPLYIFSPTLHIPFQPLNICGLLLLGLDGQLTCSMKCKKEDLSQEPRFTVALQTTKKMMMWVVVVSWVISSKAQESVMKKGSRHYTLAPFQPLPSIEAALVDKQKLWSFLILFLTRSPPCHMVFSP